MNINDENTIIAYKCRRCGSLYSYDINKDKVHIAFDYLRNVLGALILYLIYLIFMDLIK